jgi:hypothetical protein
LCALAALLGCVEVNKNYCEHENDSCTNAAGLTGICRENLCDPGDAGSGSGGRGGSGSGGRGGSGGSKPNLDALDGAGGSGGGMTFDANEVLDVITGDVLPDGACNTPADCPNGNKACLMTPTGGVCKPCVPPATGPAAPLYCEPNKLFCVDNQCKGCQELGTNPCAAPTPLCNKDTGACAECLTSADCSADMTKPICTAGKCTKCGTGAECAAKDANNPACLPTGSCVGCGLPSDCKDPAAPACVANKCVACTNDQQCVDRAAGPGLCITDPDGKAGRCATEEETIYVGTTSCLESGKGTGGQPFCTVQKAVSAVSATRRVIVIRGGVSAFDPVVVNPAGGNMPLNIIGTGGAVIAPGRAEAGIVVSQNLDVRVRGLTIRGGEQLGVRAVGSATIRLNRCIIKDNRQGGLDVMGGAGYDVSNCVFEGNGANGATAGAIGAARLNATTRPARFRSSTILNNVNGGINCGDSGARLFGLLMRGNEINPGCMLVESCSEDPMFSTTAPYHLTAGSTSARDMVSLGNAPWDDLDGDLRADGSAKTDCGADDFRP